MLLQPSRHQRPSPPLTTLPPPPSPQVKDVLGADGLVYQDVEDLLAVGYELNPNIKTFDAACFDAHYVTGDIDEQYLARLESSGRGASRTRSGQKTSLVGAAAA